MTMDYADFKKELKLYAKKNYQTIEDTSEEKYIITNGKSYYRVFCTPEQHLAMQLLRPIKDLSPSNKLYELVNNMNKVCTIGSYFITTEGNEIQLEFRGHFPLTVKGNLNLTFACTFIDQQFIWMETASDVLKGNISVRKFHTLINNPEEWKKLYITPKTKTNVAM